VGWVIVGERWVDTMCVCLDKNSRKLGKWVVETGGRSVNCI